MSKYRSRLPQLDGGRFLTDSGLETTLIFHDGYDLPFFEAFTLGKTNEGRARLDAYFKLHLKIAQDAGVGFILETPTWRANRDWAEKLGIGSKELADIQARLIGDAAALREAEETTATPIVISGSVGPRGDGYNPGLVMTEEEALTYHIEQLRTLAQTEVDCATAMTLTNIPEAMGIARAAREVDLPIVISFTLETDGRLPTGDLLSSAIEDVDAATDSAPAYYMINCAHPEHFTDALSEPGRWRRRLQGVRANASRKSHAELDESETLDAGNPQELGEDFGHLIATYPNINVLGGCCGTDHRHIVEIAKCYKVAV